ncbi:hypothetical protein RvY_06300 [Ramazzottius varieornatus]|uniref:Uncharacterized protein n=1 Tax=Ramazzottius varieornatus TaxID=947166 RepID=A0A1D1V1K7_RAMVA|nr:hypothetical protein RvY_06300 [Ramazzottius varieornatus]
MSGREGLAFVEVEDPEDYTFEHIIYVKNSFDLKMKSLGPDGKPTSHGFVVQQLDQAYVAPKNLAKNEAAPLTEVCHGELLQTARQLAELHETNNFQSLSMFCKSDSAEHWLAGISGLLRVAPYHNARKRNLFFSSLAFILGCTKQTLYVKLCK